MKGPLLAAILLAGCAAQPPQIIYQQLPPKPTPRPAIYIPADPWVGLSPQVREAIQTGDPDPLKNGMTVNYLYDPNPGKPWVVNCKPMWVAMIELAPDEQVVSIDGADSEGWHATVSDHTVMVHTKLDPQIDKAPLVDGLSIVTTKRRYPLMLRLANPPTLAISWRYPDDVKAQAEARKEALALAAKEKANDP